MSKGKIEIIIDAEGNTKIGVTEVKGAACSLLTKVLEEALGEVESDTKTKEYYERASHANHTVRAKA